MWGTDEKDHTEGPEAIQNRDHSLKTEGDTQFYTLILSTKKDTKTNIEWGH